MLENWKDHLFSKSSLDQFNSQESKLSQVKVWTQDDSFNGKKQLLGPPSIEFGESSGCWNPTKEIALHTRIYRYIHFSSKWLDTYTFTYSKKLSHLKKKKIEWNCFCPSCQVQVFKSSVKLQKEKISIWNSCWSNSYIFGIEIANTLFQECCILRTLNTNIITHTQWANPLTAIAKSWSCTGSKLLFKLSRVPTFLSWKKTSLSST